MMAATPVSNPGNVSHHDFVTACLGAMPMLSRSLVPALRLLMILARFSDSPKHRPAVTA
jgi:hypothetical protein